MKRILFVDDDERVLRGLQRMLHPLRKEWEFQFAGGGEEALRILCQGQFDVVVSDMRMPGMDGAQLLERIREIHPDIVRIVLSGQSDEETVLRSVSAAHQYLSKPCDAEIVVSTIRRACRLRDLLSHPRLKQLISQVRTLPTLPSLYTELITQLKRPDAAIADIGKVISRDVGMATKILQLVNSAFFGLYQHIASPEQAVAILGLKTIKALVLSVQLFSQFEQSKLEGFPLEQIAKHGMATGTLAKIIAQSLKQDQHTVDDSFIAGLLHDTGKIVLADSLPHEYALVMKATQEKGMFIWESERDILGATHAEVGAYLLGLWGLPDPIVEALAFHHCPRDCSHQGFAPLAAVHVADILVHEEFSGAIDGPVAEIDMEYIQNLGFAGKLPEWRNAFNETCPVGSK